MEELPVTDTPRSKRVTTRTFPIDGNEFYVLVSVVMYGVHDMHKDTRQRLWNNFSMEILGIPITTVLSQQQRPPSIVSTCAEQEWFLPWLSGFDVRARRGIQDTNLLDSRWVEAAFVTLKTHLMDGVRIPSIEIVVPLVTAVFNVVFVLYTPTTTINKWEPIRTWYPPDYYSRPRTRGTKHIHVLQHDNGGILSLLVHAPPSTQPIPTRIVGPLTLNPKGGGGNNDSAIIEHRRIVRERAVYSLGVYDPKNRKHYSGGPFVSPAAGLNPDARLSHYMRFDARLIDKRSLVFIIEGCRQPMHVDSGEQEQSPIYIFATKTVSGHRHAAIVGYWPVDYTDPSVGLTNEDDGLIIVPATSTSSAKQIVVSECKCIVSDDDIAILS